jgi:hypothetical protein
MTSHLVTLKRLAAKILLPLSILNRLLVTTVSSIELDSYKLLYDAVRLLGLAGPVEGDGEIYLFDPTTSCLTQMTNNDYNDFDPV